MTPEYPRIICDDPVVFRKVRQEWGWMQNFAPHKVEVYYRLYPTAEHAFQALRLKQDDPVVPLVANAPTPKESKIHALRGELHYAHDSEEEIQLMAFITWEKLRQCSLFSELDKTGDRVIIEDVSARIGVGRSEYWGAGWHSNLGAWHGTNILGEIFMSHRRDWREGHDMSTLVPVEMTF